MGNVAARFESNTTNNSSLNEIDAVNSYFINRNPRNLEFMRIARKESGWAFHHPSKDFYHRLVFEQSTRQTKAYVEHYSGKEVIVASTRENAISSFLHSSRDVAACRNLGRVIGRRCMESGISHLTLLEPEQSSASTKFQAFRLAVEESGVAMAEPAALSPLYEPGIDYGDPAQVQDLQERQRRVATPGQLTARWRRYWHTRRRYKTVKYNPA